MTDLAIVETGIVNIYGGQNQDRVVSGRELYEFLEVKTPYKQWLNRMIDYGFEENVDYLLVTQKSLTNNPKNPYTTITDHQMKIDMAKEIAMIQRNEKGKMARQYFIEVEKKYQSMTAQPPTTLEALQTMINSMVENERRTTQLELEQKETKDKIVYLETEFNKESTVEGYVTNDNIARQLSVFSASGKPHSQFIDAVAQELKIYNTKIGYSDVYIKVVRQTAAGGVITGVAYYTPTGVELIQRYVRDNLKTVETKYKRGEKKGQFNKSEFNLGSKTYRFNEATQEMYG